MSHIFRLRRMRRAIKSIAWLGLALVIVVGLVACTASVMLSSREKPVGVSVATSPSIGTDVRPLRCSESRTMKPGRGEAPDLYFRKYLECVEPGISQRPLRYAERYDDLLKAFQLAFPGVDVRATPPGVTLQLVGEAPYESFMPRNSGLESK